jgi:signal transduction histidine kinase/DNA-binding response OmpR family regulator
MSVPQGAGARWLARLVRRSGVTRLGAEVWVALAVCAFIWITIFLHLAEERRQALAAAQNDVSRLARAFEDSLRRSVREIDQTLLYVRALHDRDGDTLDLAPWVNAGEEQRSLALQVSLAGGDGIVTMTNLLRAREHVDLSDRPHFRYFVVHPEDTLFISVPVVGRVSRTATIQFVRRLTRIGRGPPEPAGPVFDGIVVVSVQPATLVRFHQTMEMDAAASVTVTGLDGIVRAQAGAEGTKLGEMDASPASARLADQPASVFEWQDPADGVTRIVGARRVAGLPLVVEVALPRDATVTRFQGPVEGNLIGGAVLTVAVVLSAAVTSRHRRRLRVTQATLAAAVESMRQGLLVVRPDGRIVTVNRRWRELLEVPAHLGPGSSFSDLAAWHLEQDEVGAELSEPVLRRMLATGSLGQDMPSRYVRRRPNGSMIEVVSCFLEDGTLVRTFDDVSEREAHEEALTRARDAAESAARARSQFLAVMSHEIRTPLNGIIGVSELLRGAGLNPEQHDKVELIAESGAHLLALVNDILEFSRIEHAGIELEDISFEPRAVMLSLGAMFAGQAQERGLTLAIDVDEAVPAWLSGDPHRLRQVLINLVGNALKFTDRGGVWVELRGRPGDEAGVWRLEGGVRDSGIGMAPEAMQRLFQEFTQLDGSITRRFGGSGLGLAISRRLVEAMGGEMSVQSAPGVGSVFRFDVRVGIAEQRPAAVASPPATPAGQRVLLAEDQKVNAIVARGMLERLGCMVTTVGNGREAVDQLSAAAGQPCVFDVVLMDVMMPEMDGLAATRAIRLLPGAAASVPIVGLTANAFASDRAACLDAGMTGFVSKPVTLQKLAEALAAAVEARGGTAEREGVVPPRLEVIEALTATLGAATVAGLIAAFRADLPAQLARMTEWAATGDTARLTREAHALAGTAATIGMTELADAARSIERGLRAGEVTDMPAKVEALQGLVATALRTLATAEERLAA